MLKRAELVTLLPVETFFATRGKRWALRVSPDGQSLLWMALQNGTAAPQFGPLVGTPSTPIAADKPTNWAVDYLLLEGEGHSLRALNSQLRLALALEVFLGKHLHGRICRAASSQPLGMREHGNS